jgi:hypothetical protein
MKTSTVERRENIKKPILNIIIHYQQQAAPKTQTNDILKPVILKRQVATKHKELKTKPIEIIDRKLKSL